MTTPLATRFSDQELVIIDRLVSDWVGRNRFALGMLEALHLGFEEESYRNRADD